MISGIPAGFYGTVSALGVMNASTRYPLYIREQTTFSIHDPIKLVASRAVWKEFVH